MMPRVSISFFRRIGIVFGDRQVVMAYQTVNLQFQCNPRHATSAKIYHQCRFVDVI